ncbi:FitA-like ribbon-helix-helix domain-containing protein [Synoicihabitans lomoniglobus]|uniref:FitA-like ribbon-helix-helix domain-containing protein n=1 Tax=Synoicihabitans lomoniglobus TaxID=2909285 RepID=UPI003CE495AE
MKTITIRDVPEDLLAGLKQTAKRSRRSLNQQVLVCLEEAWVGKGGGVMGNVEAELAEIRLLRGNSKPMTAAEIDAAKRGGRA